MGTHEVPATEKEGSVVLSTGPALPSICANETSNGLTFASMKVPAIEPRIDECIPIFTFFYLPPVMADSAQHLV